ncbi:DNA mismatch repair protein MutS [Alteribacillus bidgolensis]|uniref:DNA mismatch repair protein MutS n=1 Tax=Alteribacillus bidgolensis TaxID=930129 RepID=A0A1G8D994_9BACI|nr:DNA mismatch repair protein MutS [Alteribacillus bidgolensis]SDH54281.1 DNA mismatch repair protein MutS [Alteribacillus bidgolensis]
MAQETPMIKQYKQIKSEYEDAFLFFRLGDFYELFFDDAIKAARELEITLTKRGSKNEQDIPMCGVPYHSAEQYISTLIEKGYKIAICEQVEDPKTAKGVVKREVTQLITPGTVMEGKAIQENENNFIAALYPFNDKTAAFIKADLTTGETAAAVLGNQQSEWEREITRSDIKELVVPPDFHEDILRGSAIIFSIEPSVELAPEFEKLCEQWSNEKLQKAVALLTNYFKRTQKRALSHLQPVRIYKPNEHMQLDLHSRRNLELTESLREKKKKGSLLWLMDQTVTAMGGRLAKKWLEEPLLNIDTIHKRQSLVESLLEYFFEREDLRDRLRHVYDLERLAGKTSYGNVNARELVQLRRSLQELPNIFTLLKKLNNEYAGELVDEVEHFHDLRQLLEDSLAEDPPLSITDGGIIREGYNKQLDEYREASTNGKEWISKLEQQERSETGIKSLKVGFNKVFGYYIEVTKPNIPSLPEGRYERKQTLTNAERFITPELKEKESLILGAEQNSTELEHKLFLELREKVKKFIPRLQKTARIISEIDVLQGFALVSEQNQYVKPEFSNDRTFTIHEGRHPVVEHMLNHGDYVANDIFMHGEREMLLITGPNMAGKSTYMRQAALISVMAQTGCFVPAAQAKLPIFDQIFTRIGAADDLASGQSTFMVEMLETKHALAKATPNSLILLDEIGRGTSTYDGMALAQSIVEYIHDHVGAKTLFSTHYHELTTLEEAMTKLQNVHVRAVEEAGEIVFLHKVEEGKADRSYGIYVAKLAELPKDVLLRAEVLLAEFEQTAPSAEQSGFDKTYEEQVIQSQYAASSEQESITTEEYPEQLSLFQPEQKSAYVSLDENTEAVIKEIKNTDVLHMSPIEALEALYKYQRKLRS